MGIYVGSGQRCGLGLGSSRAGRLVAPVPAADGPPSDGLFFALPDTSSNPKKVFGHLMSILPMSIDNATPSSDYYATQYLSPTGESNGHVASGGFLRNRPMPRAVRGGNYAYEDAVDWVTTAKNAGLDGFTCNMFGDPADEWGYHIHEKVRDAANDVAPGFLMVPNLDAAVVGTGPSAATVASWIAQFYGLPSTYMVGGTMIVSSFLAEGYTPTRWGQIASALLSNHGITAKFIFVFNDNSSAASYTSLAHASGIWGPGGDQAAASGFNSGATAARARGEKALIPAWPMDNRPDEYWAEALNTTTWRNHWNKIISEDADLVQICTWNDFSEGAETAPSPAKGQVFLDIGSYYITKWKTGSFPTVLSDAIYLTYRNHASGATVLGPQTYTPYQNGSTPISYKVEALAFLTTTATVEIIVNGTTSTFSGSAGMNIFTATAAAGSVSGRIVRSGTPVVTLNSPVPIRSTVWVHDRQYFGFGSVRGTTGQFDPMYTSAGAKPTYP